MPRKNSKRSKIELYAQILEIITHYPEGIRITRLSYGVGVPIDRLKLVVDKLCSLGLARRSTYEDDVYYGVMPRGLEFLDTYFRMNSYLDELEDES